MNENLNLVTILKDCPAGTKLYSLIDGVVYFSHIVKDFSEDALNEAFLQMLELLKEKS